jgi:hypothetical protein
MNNPIRYKIEIKDTQTSNPSKSFFFEKLICALETADSQGESKMEALADTFRLHYEQLKGNSNEA